MNAPNTPASLAAAATAVSVRDLSLAYDGKPVLQSVGFDIPAGQVLALLGPSGCGKTTLLRLLAGLLVPGAGRIEILGRCVADAGRGSFLPPEARGLGMVFQDYALWPHMSVAANVAFPLEMRKVPAAERRARVAAALDRVGLAALAGRRISDMSGGQQQRVAIARAIVAEPPLVLFDEPLSNLDRELRETMVGEIGALVAQLGLTAVYVTHDQTEAFALADRVAVMQGGRIAQLAPPEALVAAPASAAVAEFLRLGPVVTAERGPGGWRIAGTDMQLGPGPAAVPGTTAPAAALQPPFARALLPARAVRLGPAAPGLPRGEVLRSQFRGDGHAVTLRLCGTDQEILVPSPVRATAGEILGLGIRPEDLRWFPGATDDQP